MQSEFEKEDNFLKQFKFNPNAEINEPKKSISDFSISSTSLMVGILIFFSLNLLSTSYKSALVVNRGVAIQQQFMQQDMVNLLSSFDQKFYQDIFNMNNESIKNNIANPYFSANGLVKWHEMLNNNGLQDLVSNNHAVQSNAIPYSPAVITSTRIDNVNGIEYIVKIPMNMNHTFSDKTISVNGETTLKMIKNPDVSSPHKFLIEDININQSFK